MKQIKKLFYTVLLLFGISSISPLLVPFSIGDEGNINAIGYIAGILFWLGLILGICGYALLGKVWKRKGKENVNKKKIPTALRFFSNPHAKVVDGVMFVGIAGVIYSLFNIGVNEWLTVICLVMMLAGIYGHFLVNGNIYEYILSHKK